jgi:hypothetical protein
MPALAFTDQQERLRRILQNALAGATYETSRPEEDGHMLVIEARRADGKQIGLRFRGVRESEATAVPVEGSSLRLQSVGSANRFSLIGLFFPFLRPGSRGAARVRIEIGAARLEVVCEDAEWWEA